MVGFNTGKKERYNGRHTSASGVSQTVCRSQPTSKMTTSTAEFLNDEIARLDPINIINLARDYCDGYTLQDISDLYGISFASACRICKSSEYNLCCY